MTNKALTKQKFRMPSTATPIKPQDLRILLTEKRYTKDLRYILNQNKKFNQSEELRVILKKKQICHYLKTILTVMKSTRTYDLRQYTQLKQVSDKIV